MLGFRRDRAPMMSMLQKLSKEKKWRFVAAAVALVLVVWFAIVPHLVRSRMVAAAAARGMTMSVEGVWVTLTGVHARKLVLTAEGGQNIALRGVEFDGWLPLFVLRGASALEGILADELTLRGDLETVRNARARSESAPQARRSGLPRVAVKHLSIDGTFRSVAVVGSGALELQDGVATLDDASFALGDWLSVDGLSMRVRSGAQPQLEQLRAQELRFVSGDTSRAGLQALRRRNSDETREASDEGTADGPLRYLANEASLRIERASVVRERNDKNIVRELRLELERQGDVLTSRGGGDVQGGALEWDLSADVASLSANGRVRAEHVPFELVQTFLPDVPWSHGEEARFDADVLFSAPTPDVVDVQGQVALENLAIDSRRLAANEVRGISMSLEGHATWTPSSGRLQIEELAVTQGLARVRVTGAIERNAEHYAADLQATLETSPCDAVVHALPADLLGEVSQFGLSGQMGGRGRLHLDSLNLEATTLEVRVANACRFEEIPRLADVHRFEQPFLHRVTEGDGQTFEMTTGPGSGNWTSMSSISPFLVHAVLGHEDGGFLSHAGFSVDSIRGALVRNLQAGRYVIGASTISMQLAKNLFLRREKTLARKVQEVVLTWWLESALSKERLLELYLNVIEYGPSVYGITHASQYYFATSPANLTAAQSAFLATILPNPPAYHEQIESGQLSVSMQNRVRRFLDHLLARGRIDAIAHADGVSELPVMRFGEGAVPRRPMGSVSELPFGGMATGEVIFPDGESMEEYYDEGAESED